MGLGSRNDVYIGLAAMVWKGMGGKDERSPSELKMSVDDGGVLLLLFKNELVSMGENEVGEPKPRFLNSEGALLAPIPNVSNKFKSGGDEVLRSWEVELPDLLLLLLPLPLTSNLRGSSLSGE